MAKKATKTLDQSTIIELKSWDAGLCLQRLVHEIRSAKAEERVKAAFGDLSLGHAVDWIKDPGLGDTFGKTHFQTVVRVILMLEKIGIVISLDDIIRTTPKSGSLIHRLKRLEDEIVTSREFDSTADRVVRGLAEEISDKIRVSLQEERDAIINRQVTRKVAHVSGREIRMIGECSDHIRVVSNHLNIGLEWNELTVDMHSQSEQPDFWKVVDRLKDTRYTFILPDSTDAPRPGTSPAPFAPEPPTWPERVEQFKSVYSTLGTVSEKDWNLNTTFVHTELPIPVGYILFDLSRSGARRLSEARGELWSWLEENGRHFLETTTGNTVLGLAIPCAGVVQYASLLDRCGLLHASNAFIDYWKSTKCVLEHKTNPCDGLPVEPGVEYQSDRSGA